MTEPEATMAHLTIDPRQWPELLAGTSPVEVRTPEGRKVGVFTPCTEKPWTEEDFRALFDFDRLRTLIEEHKGKGRSLQEVLADRASRDPEA